MKKSNRGGLEPSATTTEQTDAGDGVELIADGSIAWRVLLSAAATLSSLPAGDNTVGIDDGTSEDKDGSPKEADVDYGQRKVIDTSGGLELYAGIEDESKTDVTVSSHPEGIGLRLSNEVGAMSALLLPEDIGLLCRELLDARERTCPDHVEYSREWIIENYREDGTDADE